MSKLGNRKKAEEYMLKVIKDGDPSGRTYEEIKKRLSKMTDQEFHAFIQEVKAGREFIPIIAPIHSGRHMTIEKAIDLCEKYDIPLFQRYWYRHPILGVKTLSTYPAPFLYMMVRRQIETLDNKISVTEDNNRADILTGQAIDGASAITQPESLVLIEKGLEDTLIEKLKYRGGDIEGGRLFDQRLIEQGAVSTEALQQEYRTTTRVVQTMDIFFTAAHYETNIDPNKGN